MATHILKRGDVVGFVFAQPGNDTTYMVLTDVRAENADAWDLSFDMEVKALKLDKLWAARESEMNSRISFADGKRSGTFSVHQLAKKAKKKLGVSA